MTHPNWHQAVTEVLPRLGHRNWIVIADAAYPEQIAPGITTIVADEAHEDVVRTVLRAIENVSHVRPSVLVDAEMDALDEVDSPGGPRLAQSIHESLVGFETTTLPHEEIIGQLDTAGSTFRVIVVKTRCVIPYTSVFIRLECGYWSAAAESRLRSRMSVS